MKLAYLLALLSLLGASCKSSEPTPPIVPAQPVQAVPPTPLAAAQPELVVSSEAGQALVQSWVEAQNAQDFAAYERMYAARFTGIKRAGEKTTRFDRAGWLRDRASMFKRGFEIEAANVVVRSLGASAVVSFDQAFHSHNFSDRGPKQLVLALEQGQLRIAREELLQSEPLARVASHPLSEREFAMVRSIGQRRFWMARVSPEGQKIDGAPELIEYGSAFGKVLAVHLPAALHGLDGATVVTDPGSDASCEVVLKNWGVLVDFIPHFGDQHRWEGRAEDAEQTAPMAPAKVAREIFGPNTVTGADHFYAVEISAATQACEGANWARDKALPAVPVYAVEELDAVELAALRPRVRKTRDYLEAQKSYRESGGSGFWDDISDGTLSAHECEIGASRFLLTSLFTSGSCQEFSGEMSALWRVQGKSYRLLPVTGAGAFNPLAALDLDGDGIPEWLSEHTLLAWDGTSYSIVVSVEPSNYDCPC